MKGSARRTLLLCVCHVFSLGGASAFAALIPVFIGDWQLSNTEAGWIAGLFYAGYACAVPILMSLTDRIDARRIYLGGAVVGAIGYCGFLFWADGFLSAAFWWTLAGIGLAGTYMPGLRMLVDRVEPEAESRAVAFYTACFSLGTALSFLAAGELGAAFGWRAAFAWGAIGVLAAAALVLIGLGPRPPEPPEEGAPLFDFRAVFRNRLAMGYVLAYFMHAGELFAFRAWVVAFLAFSLSLGSDRAGPVPTTVATLAGLVAMAASILGSETAQRFGRRRVIAAVLAVGGLGAFGIGFAASLPYGLLVALVLVYAGIVQADSAALTAGTVSAADEGRRGTTLAVHSFIGSSGAFLGPVVMGVVLDLGGGAESAFAWGLAFASLGLMSLVGIAALWWARDGRGSGSGR